MKAEILLCCVGGQNVQPYFSFFEAYAKMKKENIRICANKGFSPERCSEDYSIHIGNGFGDIVEQKADVVIALEQLEAVRLRHYPSDEGAMIVSSKRIASGSVICGRASYPKDCLQKCINDCFRVFSFDLDTAYSCFLSLRLIGENIDFCKEVLLDIELCKILDIDAFYSLEKVFAAKCVKA